MNGAIKFLKSTSIRLPSMMPCNLQPGRNRFYSTLLNGCKLSEKSSSCVFAIANNTKFRLSPYSTKSNQDEVIPLSDFLDQEVKAEQEAQKVKTIPSKIDDFDVELNGADIILSRKSSNETIEISFSVNDSVEEPQYEDDAPEDEHGEMTSKPTFYIDIKRGDTTLGFVCAYSDSTAEDSQVGDVDDIFSISEVTIFRGEADDTNYRVNGNLLDACLYDLLMNLLDEKGITNEFVYKMSELATAYEHSSYISFLRELKKFAV